MRRLLTTTALCGIASLLSATAAQSETVISTAITTPVSTAGQDLRITSAGSVKPPSGVAVTMNSNNNVRNEGGIAIRGANNATGILANADLAGNITNTGTITIDEDYTPTDSDNDGDIDGPFAQGSNRFGIRVAGPLTGNVVNSGSITIEGNQSAGIALDGTLTGSLSNTGAIKVLGTDTMGIRTGAVTGSVAITSGSIAAQGQNAVGLYVGGDVGGALTIQGTINSTGYRYPTPPADPSKLDSDDLLQGGSAVVVAGNVAGGILLDARPPETDSNDTDEDDDGTPDAQETTAAITSYGAAPALAIGSSTQGVSIGAVGSTGYGLVVKGAVTGTGVYEGVSATAISIGGTGHAVNVAGGATISGSVIAAAKKADATAIRILSGASVPTIDVSGTVRATGGGTDATRAQAILVDAGANVTTIRNSGTIEAGVAGSGTAAAIVDNSGNVSMVENRGAITAATAIDLRSNGAGATVRQLAAATGRPAPSITGNILLGAGNDLLDIQAGSLTGNVDFGGGADLFNLGGQFRGQLLNSGATAVTVGSGALLDVTTAGAVNLGSLTTASGGGIGVTITETGHTRYNVAGTASFGTGTNVVVTLQKLGTAVGTYTIVDAVTLVGGSNLVDSVVLPFLFNSELTASEATGEVNLGIALKSDSELGLNTSEAAVLDAALAAADADQPIAAAFLGAVDSASLRNTVQQLLPEHAGGAFETATKGSRIAARFLTDPNPPLTDMGGWSMWAQQVAWARTKSIGSTSSYKLSGWGASLGAETALGAVGSVGLSLGYHAGRDGRGENDLISNDYELGAYWRGGKGPLRGFARAAIGRVNFDQTRRFVAMVDDTLITREAESDWNGTLYSATAGAFYDARFGRFSARPSVSIEHYNLTEKGYGESGGGDAFNLIVDGRSSSETSANASLSLGYELLSLDRSNTWLRIELEGGRRELIGGELGATTARFAGGTPFTLVAEERTSGWVAGLRAIGGSAGIGFAAEVNAEEQQGNAAVGGRLGLQLPF